MIAPLTNSSIDRLGYRLRDGILVAADITLLDQYCRTFTIPYEIVLTTIREQLHLAPTGRPQKSTHSIIEKLRRDKIMLSRIQDIAGCRIVVPDISFQDWVLNSIMNIWPCIKLVDRRTNPSYGYRAVHLIPRIENKRIEIQVRTKLQHLWAQFSEKIADLIDPTIKYGGGPKIITDLLLQESGRIAKIEVLEQKFQTIVENADKTSQQVFLEPEQVKSIKLDIQRLKTESEENMNSLVEIVESIGKNP